jgi:hypothetical protein
MNLKLGPNQIAVIFIVLLALSPVAIFLGPDALSAQKTNAGQKQQASPRVFVQEFYDWYLSQSSQTKSLPPLEAALKYKRSAFSSKLFQSLKEDLDAQAKSPDEIVGLDFDPILGSQDPSTRFVVSKITRMGDNYLVDVYGISSGKKREHVVPELTFRESHWVFVNFHYDFGANQKSQDANLLVILRSLKLDRQKPPQ